MKKVILLSMLFIGCKEKPVKYVQYWFISGRDTVKMNDRSINVGNSAIDMRRLNDSVVYIEFTNAKNTDTRIRIGNQNGDVISNGSTKNEYK